MADDVKTKRPAEVLDYSFDFAAWLAGDTIADATVDVDGVTLDDATPGQTAVLAWFSGGTAHTVAKATCTATTAGGRTKQQALYLRILGDLP